VGFARILGKIIFPEKFVLSFLTNDNLATRNRLTGLEKVINLPKLDGTCQQQLKAAGQNDFLYAGLSG
jgi:hypothetical protein